MEETGRLSPWCALLACLMLSSPPGDRSLTYAFAHPQITLQMRRFFAAQNPENVVVLKSTFLESCSKPSVGTGTILRDCLLLSWSEEGIR